MEKITASTHRRIDALNIDQWCSMFNAAIINALMIMATLSSRWDF